SDQKDNTHDTSANTKFAKQSIVENLPTIGESHALSKPVTSNSVSTPQESKGIDNTKTRRPQPSSNTKHDRVPSASKSSRNKNKEAGVKEQHRNLLLSKNTKHMSSPKKVGFIERLATTKPRKPRFLLRWSPTGKLFDRKGKILESSKSESQSDCPNDDNACSSNTMEPKIKRFPNSTSLVG
nr:hypothetical protein [Tanacetum cinerariifolium]